MKTSQKLGELQARCVAQATRLDAVQAQVNVLTQLLKETIAVQQLLYVKKIIIREEVKDELERHQKTLADRIEKAREQAAVQSEDAGTDEDSSGDGESGVLPDEGNGRTPPRPALWTPGGYV